MQQPSTEPSSTEPSTSWPTVTVVIATRDRPQLVRETLASVAAQDYPGEVEALVVHDRCEPDVELEALSQPRRRVRVLANTRTPGLPGARNTGVLAATSDLVAFCDDDDVWLPAKTTRQVELLRETGADVCTSGVRVTYEGRVKDRVPSATRFDASDFARRRVLEGAHPSTFLVRRAAFEQIGLVDEEIPGGYGEDFEWILRAAQHGGVVSVPAPLVTVRWGATSYFSSRWKMISDSTDYLLEKHPVLSQDPVGLAEHQGRKAFALAAQGRSTEARRAARQALALNWKERRAYLALAVSAHMLSAGAVMRVANTAGKGI